MAEDSVGKGRIEEIIDQFAGMYFTVEFDIKELAPVLEMLRRVDPCNKPGCPCGTAEVIESLRQKIVEAFNGPRAEWPELVEYKEQGHE